METKVRWPAPVCCDALLLRAQEALSYAYAPYSRFLVGAAVATDDGSIFCGANVENASFGLTMCAERNAAFAAVSAGHRKIRALAVVALDGEHAVRAAPCGACLQILAEFMDDDGVIVLGDGQEFRLAELFPHAFRLRAT